MKRLLCLVLLVLGIVFPGSSALADGVRPVTLRMIEKEPDRFLVQWRVPQQLPTQAIPSPVLPEQCRPTGERTSVERSGAWLLQQNYECPGGLSGQVVGIDYPFLNVMVSTLVRVELLSGERYARMLAPGEDSWRVPESTAGGIPPLLRDAREAVLDGVHHFAGNPVHFAFLLSLLLIGGFGTAVRLAAIFTVGQLVAVVFLSVSGIQLGPAYAEIGVAVAAALLAREALRPPADRKQLTALVAVAGLVHGLGIAGMVAAPATQGGGDAVYFALVVLGLDAALVLSIMAVSFLGRLVPRRLSRAPLPAVVAYMVGGVALALAFFSPVPGSNDAVAEAPGGLQLPGLSIAGAAGSPASKRVAAWIPDAALQSFVVVDAFEVRHEVLVRLTSVADRFGIDPSGTIAIESQDEVKSRARELVTIRASVAIDGETVEPVEYRVDFLTLDAQGVLPRRLPVSEPVEAAWLGVTAIYATTATPQEVEVTWEGFDAEATIPANVTDPESSRSVELNAGQPTLRWENQLSEDPAPVVRTTAVEPVTLWVPLLSLVPLGVLALLGLMAIRGRRRGSYLALGRVMLVCALLLGPVGGVAWALPFDAGSVPGPDRARRILAGVLPNVYRALEFSTESAVYDRLALSVTGKTLSEVYLQQRRAVEAEERGGARTRVEAVEVLAVAAVHPDPGSPRGFVADVTWTVGGTVTHFGHRHFRQNRYDAQVTVVPVDGSWKIQSIEVFDEKRLQ